MVNKIADLLTLNSHRLTQLIEIVQFSILYIVICLMAGVFLDDLFPEVDENKPTINILLELSFHSVIVSLAVFYIRKITMIVPLIYKAKGYSSHTHSYSGEVVIAIVFFTTQKKILDKINILHDRFLYSVN
tara:strand:+ start:325 stop:717 length:393 start_codon:yes stop_codon:yes gene_type:complete